MAQVLGQLSLQRSFDDTTGELGQQPARTRELFGLQATDGVIQGALG